MGIGPSRDEGGSSHQAKNEQREERQQAQLERAYEALIGDTQVREDLMNTFKEMRIVVVGKSTLIQLLLGENGPRAIRHGRPGEQNVEKEWKHPDLPVIIHDSNGISTSSGADQMAELKQFLGERQHYNNPISDFSKRVHAVWYVFNALDTRVTDDCGLLEMLDGYGKRLPLQLVMTNNDNARKINGGSEQTVLQELLELVSDAVRRDSLRACTIRVGNDVTVDGATGAILEKKFVDEEGLQSLSRSTKKMMEEDLWITWAACQAVDTDLKVEESVKFILRRRFYLPFLGGLLQRVAFRNSLVMVNLGLAKIWNASQNLEKAILSTKYLHGERLRALLVNQGNSNNLLPLLEMLRALTRLFTLKLQQGESSYHNTILIWFERLASLLTPTTPNSHTTDNNVVNMLGDMVGQAIAETGNASKLFMSYALLVLGAAMYAHMHVTHQASRSVDDYMTVMEDFLCSEWASQIATRSQDYTSMWNIILGNNEDEKIRLQSDMTEFFEHLCQQKSR